MKRIVSLILLALILLTACQPTAVPTPDTAVFEAGETYTDIGGVEIAIRNMVWSADETRLEIDRINHTAFDVMYGETFHIERECNGEWESAAVAEDMAFNAIGYIQKANSVQTQTYHVTHRFDITQSGRYRLKTDCFVNDNEESTKCELWAEFTVTRCGNADGVPSFIEFTPFYLRTDGYCEGVEYPVITVIHSVEELNTYCVANRERYDLEGQRTVHGDVVLSFCEFCERYDDAYFEKQVLVMILLEEGSGSVSHHVDHVKQCSDGKLDVDIRRIVPAVGTCDMAQWHILIEPAAGVDVADISDVNVYFHKGTEASR